MKHDKFSVWLEKKSEQDDTTGKSAKGILNLLKILPDADTEKVINSSDPAAMGGELKRLAGQRKELFDTVLKEVGDYKKDKTADKAAFGEWVEKRPDADTLNAFLQEPDYKELRKVTTSKDISTWETKIKKARESLEQRLERVSEQVTDLYGEFNEVGLTKPENLLDYLKERAVSGDDRAGELRKLLLGSELEGPVRANKVQLVQIIALIDKEVTGWFSRIKAAGLKAATAEYFADFFSGEEQARDVLAVAAHLPRDSGWPQYLAIGAIILGAMTIIGVFLGSPDKLASLSDTALTRGFITFIFTIGTISLFLVITASTVFDSRSQPEDKYNRAKTILSMLIGIFGTVLGYYFGLPEGGAGVEQTLELRDIVVVADDAKLKDGKFSIRTSVAGGKAPFTYYIKAIDDKANPMPKTRAVIDSPSGALIHDMDLPPTDSEKIYTIVIRVEDTDSKFSKAGKQNVTIPKAPIGNQPVPPQ